MAENLIPKFQKLISISKKKKNCGSAAASGRASGFRGENPRATSGQEENDSGRSGSFWRKLQASTGELRRRTEVEPEVDPGPEFSNLLIFLTFSYELGFMRGLFCWDRIGISDVLTLVWTNSEKGEFLGLNRI